MSRSATVPPPPASVPAPPTQRFSSPGAGRVSLPMAAEGEAARDEAVEFILKFKRQVIPYLLQILDPAFLLPGNEEKLRAAIEIAIDEKVSEALPDRDLRRSLLIEIINDMVGYGPLESVMHDADVTEIMINGCDHIFVRRRDGSVSPIANRFVNADSLRQILDRMLLKAGRRLRESFANNGAAPVVDVRLPDGTRIHVVDTPLFTGAPGPGAAGAATSASAPPPPLHSASRSGIAGLGGAPAGPGPCVTIRKAGATGMSMQDLVGSQTLSMEGALFLQGAMDVGANIVICGGPGSGKTVMLNALCGFISRSQRIVAIEDIAELNLPQPHVVRLETQGRLTAARELLNSIGGMCPDRIVVGECRGVEAAEIIRAMASGGPGIITALNAASPVAAVARLETMLLSAGTEAAMPAHVVRRQIAEAVQLVLHVSRLRDGTHRLTRIAEVQGIDDTGAVILRDIFRCEQVEAGAPAVLHARGVVPRLHAVFKSMELEIPEEIYGAGMAASSSHPLL